MSHQCIADAFIEPDRRFKSTIMADTWGHLAPKQNRTYRGFITFAVGCFGDDPLNPQMLVCEFKGLDASPWFFDAASEFISEEETEPGCVYRFDGTFRNYEFVGTVLKLADYNKV
jgi:hypothetical protein